MDTIASSKETIWKRIKQSEFMYHYKRNPAAIIGTILIVFALFMVIFGKLIAPQNPYDLAQLDLSNAYLPPMWSEGGTSQFPLGTDTQGRCILSALIYGSITSLTVGFGGALLSCVVGTILGLAAGFYGGKLDSVIMRIADIQLSFPAMLIAMFVMAMFGQGVGKLVFTLTLVGWVKIARTVRGETLAVKNKEFVEAARTIGFFDVRIILEHIMPNVITSVIVLSTIQVGDFILTESTLSFLGVGVPITEPSLGLLVKSGFDVLFSGLWWTSVFPGAYIMLLVFGINLVGDFLRDELDPKLK